RGRRFRSRVLGGHLEQAALTRSPPQNAQAFRERLGYFISARTKLVRSGVVSKEDMTFTITPLHVPESLDAPDAREWHAYVALVDEMKHEDAGSDYFDGDAAAGFAGYQHQEYATIRLLAACDEHGELVGIGNCTYENEGSTAFVSVAVTARHRGHGIEDALLAELEAMSREAGKSVAETYSFVGSARADRKSTRLNSSHVKISYAVFYL